VLILSNLYLTCLTLRPACKLALPELTPTMSAADIIGKLTSPSSPYRQPYPLQHNHGLLNAGASAVRNWHCTQANVIVLDEAGGIRVERDRGFGLGA
jgi:hypothetical protein